MSRCFPYPPPGFEESVALIGTIKLQKEKEKVKKEKKKEKKEKKEKSRGDSRNKEERRHDGRKRKHGELGKADDKVGGCFKTREDESAQLERSTITEERGPAVARNPCDSSDSTHDSRSKTKKLESAENSHGAHAGVGLRIRLPLLRHKDVEPQARSIVEQPCSTGRIETLPPQGQNGVPGRPPLPCSSEQPCFSGRAVPPPSEALAVASRVKHAPAVTSGRIRSCGCSCDSRLKRQYKKLIQDWNPSPLQVEDPESDGQDWLFGKPAAARPQVDGKERDHEGALCTWPPRACYLPEVGVYALPYVVPF